MVSWVAIGVGVLFGLFLLFYAFLAVSCLMENTGSIAFSLAVGLIHAGLPVPVLYFGYRCFLEKMGQYGSTVTLLGAVLCFAAYFFVVRAWNRIVFGDTPAVWEIGVLTALQAAVSGAFIYGFLYF